MRQLAVVGIVLTSACAGDPNMMGTGGSGAEGSGGSGGTGSNQLAIYKSGSRIKLRTLSSSDGAKAFLGWHDQDRAEDVRPGKAADGRTRMIPDDAEQALYFGDSSCTVPILMHWASNCSRPLAAYFIAAACTGNTRVFRAGPVYAGAIFSQGTTCFSQALPAGVTAYSMGAEVPPTDFAEMTEAIE